jgi:hypothetical protein
VFIREIRGKEFPAELGFWRSRAMKKKAGT